MALNGTIPVSGVSDWISIGQLGRDLLLLLNSAAGGRQIEYSLDGGVTPTAIVAVPDGSNATQIWVGTNRTVAAVRFTGTAGDAWRVTP